MRRITRRTLLAGAVGLAASPLVVKGIRDYAKYDNNHLPPTVEEFTNELLKNAREKRVVFLGASTHDTQRDNDYIIPLLPKFKLLGYDRLNLELDTHEQDLVNRFVRGEIDEQQWYDTLNQISEYVLKTSRGEVGYRIKPFTPLIRAAHKNGLEIVCFDERAEGETAPGDSIYSHMGTERNKAMFENLKKLSFYRNRPNSATWFQRLRGIVSEDTSKDLVLVGDWHIKTKELLNAATLKTETPLGKFVKDYFGDQVYFTNLRRINSDPYQG